MCACHSQRPLRQLLSSVVALLSEIWDEDGDGVGWWMVDVDEQKACQPVFAEGR